MIGSGSGSGTVQTVDAILWLLNQAGRHFSREVEVLQTFGRLMTLGVADTYHEGAQARLALLSDLTHPVGGDRPTAP